MMVTNSGHGSWVQLGWFKSKIRYGSTTRRESGVQVYPSAPGYYLWYAAQPVGSNTWYELLSEANGRWNIFINGTYVGYGTAQFTKNEHQFFGETHDREDQMPGGTTNHVSFTSMDYFTGSGHTAHVATAQFGTAYPGWYGYSNPSAGNGTIWDKGCSGS